jgi:hypothetical protein
LADASVDTAAACSTNPRVLPDAVVGTGVDAVYNYFKGALTGQKFVRDFKGKSNPVAVNDLPNKSMAMNRRVEIGIEK